MQSGKIENKNKFHRSTEPLASVAGWLAGWLDGWMDHFDRHSLSISPELIESHLIDGHVRVCGFFLPGAHFIRYCHMKHKTNGMEWHAYRALSFNVFALKLYRGIDTERIQIQWVVIF